MQFLLHDRSSLFSGDGIGELGSVLSIQMFIEQLVCRRLKVQVAFLSQLLLGLLQPIPCA